MTAMRTTLCLLTLMLLAAAGPSPTDPRLAAACRLNDPAAAIASKPDDICLQRPDPQTLPEEVVLPLPCGQLMLFRKIVVGGSTLLDEQIIHLGASAEPEDALGAVSHGPRTVPLAGAFTEGEARRDPNKPPDLGKLSGRSYYLAKYPVTEWQFRLLQLKLLSPDGAHAAADDPACAEYERGAREVPATGVLPASRISWFDAMDFVRAYNNWLLAHDRKRIAAGLPPDLPWEQGTPSTLRLPSEAEWEFAARGGAAGPQDLDMRVYRVRDAATGQVREAELSEVAQLSSEDNSDPEHPLAGVGQKLPNLFGLYDMLGDVDEIVFDLFRMTRPDALHGENGGFVVKGGNVFTPEEAMGVGYRREVPFFDLAGEVRSPTTGLRLALAPPVFVNGMNAGQRWATGRQNPMLLAALQTALSGLVVTGERTRDTAAEDLRRLRAENERGQLTNSGLKAQLAQIAAGLDASNARLRRAAADIRREKIETATLLAFNIRAIGASVFSNSATLADLRAQAQRNPAALQQLDRIRDRIAEFDRSLSKSFGFYVQLVVELARADPGELQEAADAVRREFAAEGMQLFDKYREAVLRHVARAAALRLNLPRAEQQKWLFEIDETRALRSARQGNQR